MDPREMNGFLQVEGDKIVLNGEPTLLKGRQNLSRGVELTRQVPHLQDGVSATQLCLLMRVNMENFIT